MYLNSSERQYKVVVQNFTYIIFHRKYAVIINLIISAKYILKKIYTLVYFDSIHEIIQFEGLHH